MSSFTRAFVTDSKQKIEVDGSYRIVDSNVEDLTYHAWLWKDRNDINAPFVTLTEAEEQRLYEELMNDSSTWEISEDWHDVD